MRRLVYLDLGDEIIEKEKAHTIRWPLQLSSPPPLIFLPSSKTMPYLSSTSMRPGAALATPLARSLHNSLKNTPHQATSYSPNVM